MLFLSVPSPLPHLLARLYSAYPAFSTGAFSAPLLCLHSWCLASGSTSYLSAFCRGGAEPTLAAMYKTPLIGVQRQSHAYARRATPSRLMTSLENFYATFALDIYFITMSSLIAGRHGHARARSAHLKA